MKHRRVIISLITAAVVVAICFAVNIGGAWIGYRANWGNAAATAAYILFWAGLTYLGRRDAATFRLPFIFSILSFISSILSLRAHITGNGSILDAFLSVFASVPLFGLRGIMDWRGLYITATLMSFVWVLCCINIVIKIRKSC